MEILTRLWNWLVSLFDLPSDWYQSWWNEFEEDYYDTEEIEDEHS